MSNNVIEVNGLYKKFARNLRSSMYYSAQDIARSMVGMRVPNDRLRKNEFWALQDVSFELKKGEVLGVIGINGSGKSTLLRILSGIYPPDKGSIKVNGRIGALIAVGAGIHPHMTGRENIYLNGIILGMTQKEVEVRFNEIVAFAELGPFIDSPVATYSSGMRVRLGFSIAVHVNPDIMLIDEVLAVGDKAFRNKSLRKMHELRNNDIPQIFISHNMAQVASICDRTIILHSGKIYYSGRTNDAIAKYEYLIDKYSKSSLNIGIASSNGLQFKLLRQFKRGVFLRDMKIYDKEDKESFYFRTGESLYFSFKWDIEVNIEELNFLFSILNQNGIPVVEVNSNKYEVLLTPGQGNSMFLLKIFIEDLPFTKGLYYTNIAVRNSKTYELYLIAQPEVEFYMISDANNFNYNKGFIKIKDSWEFNSI